MKVLKTSRISSSVILMFLKFYGSWKIKGFYPSNLGSILKDFINTIFYSFACACSTAVGILHMKISDGFGISTA